MELHDPPSVAWTKLFGFIAPQLVNKRHEMKLTNMTIVTFFIFILPSYIPSGASVLRLILPRKGKNNPPMSLIFSVNHLTLKIILIGCRKCKRIGDTIRYTSKMASFWYQHGCKLKKCVFLQQKKKGKHHDCSQ